MGKELGVGRPRVAVEPGEKLGDGGRGVGEGDTIKPANFIESPGQELIALAAVRFEIAFVLDRLEVVLVVLDVQLFSYDLGVVVFAQCLRLLL